MDEGGIDVQVLSHAPPGAQALNGSDAVSLTRSANDFLHGAVNRHPTRYATDLDTILRANGIRTTVFTGVSTNCCVESTAREAFMRDYMWSW
jgi:nicotinamidase-related amidase